MFVLKKKRLAGHVRASAEMSLQGDVESASASSSVNASDWWSREAKVCEGVLERDCRGLVKLDEGSNQGAFSELRRA
jgi:hypothetical protein